jgi:hypothetical protein
MIGQLPQTLTVNGTVYKIRTDYRNIFRILEAFGDTELLMYGKMQVTVKRLYAEEIPDKDFEEAYKKACWFIDGGKIYKSAKVENVRLVDWEQDEIPLFAAINEAAKGEVRILEYLHWWTFLSYYISIRPESLFAQIVNIRSKRAKGKKLEKWENEFYKSNREMIDLQKKYSKEQQAEIDRINKLFE